jgi:hypothetical protein
MRKKIEELFGEAKEFMGMRHAKFRGRRFVREQVLMTAAAQNIKRMLKLLAIKGPERVAAASRMLVIVEMKLSLSFCQNFPWKLLVPCW